jgi:anti-anti-sigma factor
VHVERRVLVALRGRVDFECAPRLKDALARACRAPSSGVVVDLDGAELRDTTALGVVLGVARSERARGRSLTIVARDPRIQELLDRFSPGGSLVGFERARGVADVCDAVISEPPAAVAA